MGKINRILKYLFIAFNTLFAILGCLLIFVAIKYSAYSHEVNFLVCIWVFAIGVLGISCLGISASASEKEIILKIFAGFMGVGMIIMLIFGISAVVTRNKGHCCGVVSASDWGDNIPNSCECSGYEGYGGYECTSKPQGVSGPDRIYAQPCNKVILMEIDSILGVGMGFCFGFAVIALLGLLISLLMIHQVRRHDGLGGSSIAMKDILRTPLTPDL